MALYLNYRSFIHIYIYVLQDNWIWFWYIGCRIHAASHHIWIIYFRSEERGYTMLTIWDSFNIILWIHPFFFIWLTTWLHLLGNVRQTWQAIVTISMGVGSLWNFFDLYNNRYVFSGEWDTLCYSVFLIPAHLSQLLWLEIFIPLSGGPKSVWDNSWNSMNNIFSKDRPRHILGYNIISLT